jgi:hypothetical protein
MNIHYKQVRYIGYSDCHRVYILYQHNQPKFLVDSVVRKRLCSRTYLRNKSHNFCVQLRRLHHHHKRFQHRHIFRGRHNKLVRGYSRNQSYRRNILLQRIQIRHNKFYKMGHRLCIFFLPYFHSILMDMG